MKNIILPLMFFLVLLWSCDEKSLKKLPTVSTTVPYDIGGESVTSGGDVIEDGGAEVTVRGVCWNTIPEPTIADNRTEDGTGIGSFTSNVKGLDFGTTYYIRAYATNSEGTSYGNEETFSTAGAGQFTDPRDGNTYKVVTIGDQIWMAENLRYLPEVHNNSEFKYRTTSGYGVYGYNGSDVTAAKASPNYATYGVIYNWHAASSASPAGWHMPSDAEWNELINFIKNDGHSGVEGMALKATTSWACGLSGTDNYGFAALAGGARNQFDGGFYDMGSFSNWWTSTPGYECCLTYRYLVCSFNVVGISPGGDKSAGIYLRCIKD